MNYFTYSWQINGMGGAECVSLTGAPVHQVLLYGDGRLVGSRGPQALLRSGWHNGWPLYKTGSFGFIETPLIQLRMGVTYVACTQVANPTQTAWLVGTCTSPVRIPYT